MSEILTADHGKESGHWYRKDGTPAYTIIGANGKERNTTLRDARKLSLLPSVTQIIKCASAPGLTNWMIDQGIMAALTLPRLEGENDADFMARVKADSKEQARKAAERGTIIHAVVQDGFEGIGAATTPYVPYYESAKSTIYDQCGGMVTWFCEKSFATARYGGKVDLYNDAYLIDIKTTDKDIETLKLWDEHYQQLAAYEEGLWSIPPRKCGILYINVNTAASRLTWATEDDLAKGAKCFRALLDYWYAKNNL